MGRSDPTALENTTDSRLFSRSRLDRPLLSRLALDKEPPPSAALVKEVLAYFVRHPHAADDLEGIARWRLVEQAIRSRVDETGRAVGWLVDRGYLCRTSTGSATNVFSLNPDTADRAKALLASDGLADPDRG